MPDLTPEEIRKLKPILNEMKDYIEDLLGDRPRSEIFTSLEQLCKRILELYDEMSGAKKARQSPPPRIAPTSRLKRPPNSRDPRRGR